MHLQRKRLAEGVSLCFAAHGDPQSERVGADLFLRGAFSRRRGDGHRDWNRGVALVALGGVNRDALDALAVGRGLPGHTGSALIARLAVEELVGEIIMLQRFEWPGGAVHVSVEVRRALRKEVEVVSTNSLIISLEMTSVHVMRRENCPFLPLTVVSGTSFTRMLA